MLLKKSYTIIGLTTFYNEFLRISVPGVAKLNQKIYLIIHNDNPNTTVTEKQIRKMGYHGPLHIINTNKNVGPLKSRLTVLSAIPDLKIKSDWMVFVDDDDILTNVDIPTVGPNTFAIMQNKTVIKRRLIDLLKIMDDPKNYIVDDNNIVIDRPNVGIAGNLIRTDIMISLGKLVDIILDKVYQVDDSLGYRAPDDAMLWAFLTIYAKYLNPAAAPIYMDRVNYIAISLDSASQKYGTHVFPPNNAGGHFESALRRYNAILEDLLKSKNN